MRVGQGTGTTEHNLAQVLHLKGDWDAAEALFRSSLVTRRKAHGDAHPRTTVHLNNLGALLRDMGKLDDAEAHIREALSLDRQIFGTEHPYVAAGLAQLAGVAAGPREFRRGGGRVRGSPWNLPAGARR